MPPPPPTSTLFPYTTLFRSRGGRGECGAPGAGAAEGRALTGVGRGEAGIDWPGFAAVGGADGAAPGLGARDRKSTRLNSSHVSISYAVFCLKKKKKHNSDTK